MSKQQEQKAKQILNKIMCVQKNTWLIPSLSEEGKYHTVNKTNDNFECDCVGFQFSQNCYHIIAIKMIMEGMEVKA